MTDRDVVSLREYFEEHFKRIDDVSKVANEATLFRLENMGKEMIGLDNRLQEVEKTKAVSAGQIKLMVGILTSIPSILALIALFRG